MRKLFLCVGLVLVALGGVREATIADAAGPLRQSVVEEKVYEQWNHWCGKPKGWYCGNRRSQLESKKWTSKSYSVAYCWVDKRLPIPAWKQYCIYVEADERGMIKMLWPSDPNKDNGRVLNASS